MIPLRTGSVEKLFITVEWIRNSVRHSEAQPRNLLSLTDSSPRRKRGFGMTVFRLCQGFQQSIKNIVDLFKKAAASRGNQHIRVFFVLNNYVVSTINFCPLFVIYSHYYYRPKGYADKKEKTTRS